MHKWLKQFGILLAICTFCMVVGKTVSFADNADVAIYRAATAGEAITTGTLENDWDTPVREDTASYDLIASDTDIELQQAGHYLVMYGIRWDSTGGSNRSVQHSLLNLDGENLDIGWSQGYIRRNSSGDQAFTTGGGIIDV